MRLCSSLEPQSSGKRFRRFFVPALLVLLMTALLFTPRIAAAQDDTSLSPSLSDPLSESLSPDTPTSGLSSEVVAGASSIAPTYGKVGISDPTGALLDNSIRTPNVSASANSDPAQNFYADVNVDAARSSMTDVYSGSRAAFQPAFAGTLAAGFRGGARSSAQHPAGTSLALAAPNTGAAFGRGTQLQAFGSTGGGSDMTGTDPNGNPLVNLDPTLMQSINVDPSLIQSIYLDPSLTQNSTLVTDVGNIPGQLTYSVPGSTLPVFASDNYAGPGGFPDSTRGTAGSPPEFDIPSEPLLSQRGLRDSPFASIQTDTFLHPTLLRNQVESSLSSPRPTTSLTPEQRRARMEAILSGTPQIGGSAVPSFEQKRADRLRGVRERPGERPSRVTLDTTPRQQ